MKNIWILTTGSSDVQFIADDDKWNRLYRKVRSQLNTIHKFSPTPRLNDDTGETFLVPARVMGMVYEEQLEENYGDLYFPLLDTFSQKLHRENTPNRIIVIFTDQEQVFTAQDRKERNCPYWQDTCKLRPIIEKYLKQSDKFPGAELEYIYLKPQSKEERLDNWNKALPLVQKELSKIKADANDKIYVSHQASTPAISSAVQFVSLARFQERVRFLVSNEDDTNLTGFVESSRYLRELQREKAKKLLDRHDYSGVKELLAPYLKPEIEIEILLDAAIQWNFAKFEDFAKVMTEAAEKYFKDNEWWRTVDEEIKVRSKEWWWMAYEAAYLGVVRLEQGNTVEAMFHSFRSVEGLLRQWVDKFYSEEIKQTKHPRWNDNERWKRNLRIYGEDLYLFLSIKKEIDRGKNPDVWIFGNQVFKKRNDLFHQLKGLQDKKAVFESWRSPNEKQWRDDAENKWKTRILNCLNFVSGETFEFLDKEDQSGKVASLMAKVHKELVEAIASYL